MGHGERHRHHARRARHDARRRGPQLAPRYWFGMRQEIRPPRRARRAGGGQQAFHQVLDVNRAEPALAAGNLQHQPFGDRFQQLKDIRIARPVNHRRPHDHCIRRQTAHHPLRIQLGFPIVRQRVRFGVLRQRRAGRRGPDRGQRTYMDQPHSPPCHGVRQLLRGAYIAGVVVLGAQRFGDARQMDHGIGPAQRLGEAGAARQIAVDGLHARRQRAREPVCHTGAAHQCAHGLTFGDELFQQVRTDEAGTASDQDHYCNALRKATSPK